MRMKREGLIGTRVWRLVITVIILHLLREDSTPFCCCVRRTSATLTEGCQRVWTTGASEIGGTSRSSVSDCRATVLHHHLLQRRQPTDRGEGRRSIPSSELKIVRGTFNAGQARELSGTPDFHETRRTERSVSEAGCPTNAGIHRPTKQRNGVCYVFFQTTKTWDQARNACHSKGGDLVIVPDSSTQNFLVASLRSLNWPRHGVWIGATDRDAEGQWIWEGTSVRLSYKNWSPNQNRQPSAGRSGSNETKLNDREDCAQIRMMDAGRWHDFPCNVSSSYICQFGSVSRPVTTKRVRTTQAARVTTQHTPARKVTSAANVAPTHPSTIVRAAATSKRVSTTVKKGATSERTSARPVTTLRHSVTARNMIPSAQSSKTPITARALTGSSKPPTRSFTSSPSTANPARVVHNTSSLTSETVGYKLSTTTPRTPFALNSTPSSGSPSSSLHPKPEDTSSMSSVRIATRPSFTTSKSTVSTTLSFDKARSLRAASATTATSHRTASSTRTTAGKSAFTLTPARTQASSSNLSPATSQSAPKRDTKLTQAAGVRSSLSSRTTTTPYGPRRTAGPPAVPHNSHLYTSRSTLHRGESVSKEGKRPGTVAGIVLGSLFGVVIIVAAVFIIWSKSKSPKLRFPDHDVAFENYSYGSSVLLNTGSHSSSSS